MLTFTTNKTANYTAAAGQLVRADVSSGGITVSLPASPAANDQVGVLLRDTNVGAGSNTVTVSGNGNTILGEGNSLELFIEGDYVEFQYQGTTDKWVIIDDRRQHHAAIIESGTVVYNNAGMTTTSTSVTIRRAGKYQVNGNLSVGVSPPFGGLTVQIKRNLAIALRAEVVVEPNGGYNLPGVTAAGILLCQAGDQLISSFGTIDSFSVVEV